MKRFLQSCTRWIGQIKSVSRRLFSWLRGLPYRRFFRSVYRVGRFVAPFWPLILFFYTHMTKRG